jgi:hypothetical protein
MGENIVKYTKKIDEKNQVSKKAIFHENTIK